MSAADVVRRLDRWSGRLEELSLAVLHAVVATLVCAAVVFRYVLDDPLTWSEELIILLFGWMVFLGIANAFRARTHIIIDVVVLFAPPALRRLLAVVAFATTTAALAAIAWYAGRYFLRELPNLTPMLGISAGWAIAPLVIGTALSILHLLGNLLDHGVEGTLWSDITQRE